jgi:hypothetical protein
MSAAADVQPRGVHDQEVAVISQRTDGRITYFAEGHPRSPRTAGLIKVGISKDPAKRMSALGTRLIGTTDLPERWFRAALLRYMLSDEEFAARGLRFGKREWYHDEPPVRALLAWVMCFRSPEVPEAAVAPLHVVAGAAA